MSATIMVQQNDANNDPIEGADGPIFLMDLDAVAQILYTRLRLLQGEWWEDLTIGFPLFQKVLNQSAAPKNQESIMLLMQETILATPYVLQVVDFSFTHNSALRSSSFTATVSTAFGTLTVTDAPGTAASVVGT